MPYRVGQEIRLHSVVSALAVPTLSNQGADIRPPFSRSSDVADLVIEKATPANLFTIEGPIYVYAFVRQQLSPGTFRWASVDTLEITSMDLNVAGDKSYRIKLSPWWQRMAVAAPNWVFNAGESISVVLRTYLD